MREAGLLGSRRGGDAESEAEHTERLVHERFGQIVDVGRPDESVGRERNAEIADA